MSMAAHPTPQHTGADTCADTDTDRSAEAIASSKLLGVTLNEVVNRHRGMLRKTRFVQGCWLWLAVLLAVIVVDVLWSWSEKGRLVVAAMLVLLAGLLLIRVWLTRAMKHVTSVAQSALAPDASHLHAASILEMHHNLHGHPLVNALWLARQHKAADGDAKSRLTRQLQERSLAAGGQVARRVDVAGAADRGPFIFHRTRLLAVITLCLLLTFLMPRLVVTGVQRLVNPWGNIPPFSLTRFDVNLPDGPVTQGSDVEVDIALHGQLPATLDWVALQQATGARRFVETQRWRLEPISLGRYRHRLARLDKQTTFELQTDLGQSRRLTIDVKPLTPAASTALPDESNAADPASQAAPTSQPTSQPDANNSQPATSDNPDVQAAAAAQQALGNTAGRLADTAQQLAQMLLDESQSQTSLTASLTPDQLAQAQAIASQFEAFNRMRHDMQDDLKAQHAAAADQHGDPASIAGAQSFMQQMAQTLGSLLTPRQQSPTAVQSPTPASMGQCLSQLATAARKDQKTLSPPSMTTGKTAGQSLNPSGQTAAGNNQPPADPSGDTQQLRSGAYDQSNAAASSQAPRTTARSRSVPEIYRPMLQRYYDRLNEDQAGQANQTNQLNQPPRD